MTLIGNEKRDESQAAKDASWRATDRAHKLSIMPGSHLAAKKAHERAARAHDKTGNWNEAKYHREQAEKHGRFL
jgi:hypothetical protein